MGPDQAGESICEAIELRPERDPLRLGGAQKNRSE